MKPARRLLERFEGLAETLERSGRLEDAIQTVELGAHASRPRVTRASTRARAWSGCWREPGQRWHRCRAARRSRRAVYCT